MTNLIVGRSLVLVAVLAVSGGAPHPVSAGGVLAAVPAPLSLTASDGSGLELVSLSAQAVIEDPLAFTELHLVFRNPESRVREGRFRITLPSGATISRFAMRIGERWQEGEIVEQHAARVAYEDFLHRRQDPALLEAEAGNEFSARVFPIPPNGTKELIVSYTQELAHASEPYRLPLRGLPTLGNLTVRALVNKVAMPPRGGSGSAAAPASSLGGRRIDHEVVELSRRAFKPDRDFEVVRSGPNGQLGLRHENLVAARVVPLGGSDSRDPVRALLVLIDTSASRALGQVDQAAAFEALMVELRKSGDPMISVAAFDQEVAPLFSGRLSAMGEGVRKKLLERRALGASDLDRALGWAAAEAARFQKTGAAGKDQPTRVLLVTDGVVTAGESGADKLRARVKTLGAVGVGRLDVLAVGGIRDDVLLGRLVTAGLARDGVVLEGAQTTAAAWAGRLTRATRSGVKVEIDGAGWVWPAVLNGVQPGDEVVVYADLPRDKPFRLRIDGMVLNTPGVLAPVERPLLERAWVRARISRLLEQRDTVAASDRDLADALRTQVIDLSVRNRVLSPFTSLLVLETEQDYARFGIERRALADILTVGAGGIALLHRTDIAAPIGDVIGDGALEEAADDRDVMSATARERAPAKADFSANGRGRAKGRDNLEAQAGGATLAKRAPASAAVAAAEDQPLAAIEAAPVSRTARAPEPHPAGPRQSLAQVDSLLEGTLSGSGSGVLRRVAPSAALAPPPAAPRAQTLRRRRSPSVAYEPSVPAVVPVEGPFREILDLVRKGQVRAALGKALAWRQRDAGDVLALVALGECWEALGNPGDAARAYGSIIDLFPGRADMRRFAGERLERLRGAAALALAIDTYRKAVEQRPDHPASHRLLGFALLKQGHPRQAFEALATGAATAFPSDRFRGVDRILREDLGLAAAAWMRAEPTHAEQIRARLARAGGTLETAPSLRFVLNWETDANDVDFHIHDAKGGHAYYSAPRLPSGGELYADVTTGYGPECFTIRGSAAGRAAPYRLQAHYYSRGPMGYGMGKLQIIDHDGRGGFRFDERPFVIMQDGAFVDLGVVTGSFDAGNIAAMAR